MTEEQREVKRRAGRLGGLATVARYGFSHMSEIGRRGAATTWARYTLAPVGQAGWALVDRETRQIKAFNNYFAR